MDNKVYYLIQDKEIKYRGTIEQISNITMLSRKTLLGYKSPKHLKKHEGDNHIKLIEVGYL